MGILHKLWDETLAGPAPDSGLGKLRKYDSFGASPTSISSSSSSLSAVAVPHEEMAISRSITIIRTKSTLSVDPASPSSSVSPSTPSTPLSPVTPAGEFRRLGRRKSAAEPTTPTVYDWIVMSALDR